MRFSLVGPTSLRLVSLLKDPEQAWAINEKITNQIVGISEVCDQNGDRVLIITKVAIFKFSG